MLERDRKASDRHEQRQNGRDYNEVVVDGMYANSRLPASIEAFVASPNDNLADVRRVHQDFLREFSLGAEVVPLVSFHPEMDQATGQVFQLVG